MRNILDKEVYILRSEQYLYCFWCYYLVAYCCWVMVEVVAVAEVVVVVEYYYREARYRGYHCYRLSI